MFNKNKIYWIKYSSKERLIIIELFPYPKRLVIKKYYFVLVLENSFPTIKNLTKKYSWFLLVTNLSFVVKDGYESQLCHLHAI